MGHLPGNGVPDFTGLAKYYCIESGDGCLGSNGLHAAGMEELFNLGIETILQTDDVQGALGVVGLGDFFSAKKMEKVSRNPPPIVVCIISDKHVCR